MTLQYLLSSDFRDVFFTSFLRKQDRIFEDVFHDHYGITIDTVTRRLLNNGFFVANLSMMRHNHEKIHAEYHFWMNVVSCGPSPVAYCIAR